MSLWDLVRVPRQRCCGSTRKFGVGCVGGHRATGLELRWVCRCMLKETVRRFLPRRIKPHRILAGPLKGRTIVTSWHDYPGAIRGRTEHELLRWLWAEVQAGETWLDVGAHYGYTSLALCQLVGPTGRVFAFEPLLETAGYLDRTRSINRLDQLWVVPLALGKERWLTPLNVPVTRGMADHQEDLGSDAASHVVYSVALDQVWRVLSNSRDHVDGVKIDVQGMEISALQGMRKLVTKHRPKLVVELHRGVDRNEFLSLISLLGYERRARAIERLAASEDLSDNLSYSFIARPAS